MYVSLDFFQCWPMMTQIISLLLCRGLRWFPPLNASSFSFLLLLLRSRCRLIVPQWGRRLPWDQPEGWSHVVIPYEYRVSGVNNVSHVCFSLGYCCRCLQRLALFLPLTCCLLFFFYFCLFRYGSVAL